MHAFFLSIAQETAVEVRNEKGTKDMAYVKEWCFADNLSQDEPDDEDESMIVDAPDAVTLQTALALAYSRGPKGRKDQAMALVERIEKCTLLHCTEDGVGKGVVETIVSRCVSIMINVSGPSPSRGTAHARAS